MADNVRSGRFEPPPDDPGPARRVRPYTITAGRTSTVVDLPFEATLRLVAGPLNEVSDGGRRVLGVAHRRSVAEVSALLQLPIGVTRVLVGDLVQQGLLRVEETVAADYTRDERIELMERTLRGLVDY
ncbi:MAG: DUF742 domain-containing protein [Nocardioides sp.]